MAQKITVSVVDDITGEELPEGAAVKVPFMLDGTSYEIDLGTASAEQFRSDVAPYIAAARKVTGGRSVSRRRGTSTANDDAPPGLVRQWWTANGAALDLPRFSNRGRVPSAVTDAYIRHEGLPPAPGPAAGDGPTDDDDAGELPQRVRNASGRRPAKAPAPAFKTAESPPDSLPGAPAGGGTPAGTAAPRARKGRTSKS